MPPVAWDDVVRSNRTWGFQLHSWDFMGPVLAAYDAGRDPVHLRWATDLALDWTRAHPRVDASDGMAWYDMAVGLRGHRLGYLVDALRRTNVASSKEVTELERCVRLHFKAYADEANFAGHSNHGLYFATGQLLLARRLPWLSESRRQVAQASERLLHLLQEQFGSDGVHREHFARLSPHGLHHGARPYGSQAYSPTENSENWPTRSRTPFPGS